MPQKSGNKIKRNDVPSINFNRANSNSDQDSSKKPRSEQVHNKFDNLQNDLEQMSFADL